MFRWYVVNTYSGHENKVKANLEHRIDSMGQTHRFRRVVVPTEQVIETKDGQKVQTEKRVLPGYVLVNMDLNADAGSVPARRVGQGHVRAAVGLRRRDRRRQPRPAEAEGARRHLRAPGPGRARLRPGKEDRLKRNIVAKKVLTLIKLQ